MKIFKIGLISLALVMFMATASYSDWEDRFSGISLKQAPTNLADFPEITAPSGNPTTNRGWLYVKDNGSAVSALYFKDDAGTVVQLGTAATQTLDGAYTNGNTIDLDAAGDLELDLTVTARKVQIANTYAGTQAIALEIDAEVAQAITDAILFNCTAGTIVDAIDAKHASITNAINVGANVIYGTGGASIDFDEFDVASGTGSVTINDVGNLGALTVEGTVLDIDSLTAVAALEVASAASAAITLNPHAGDAAGEDLIVTAHNVQLTATGALTFSPDGAVTTAITVSDTDYTNWASVGTNNLVGTTGGFNFTNFDVDASGNVDIGGNLDVTGTANLGTLAQDNLVPASASPQAITLNAGTTGKIQIGNSSTGAVELAGAGTTVDVLAGANLVISEGDLAITSTANEDVITIVSNTSTDKSALLITQSSTTTGKVISVTADGLTAGGVGLYIDSNGIPDNATFYVQLYDGSANDLTITQHGEINIAGVASTDILTLDLGDIQITAGDIDLDNGQLMVDSIQDLSNNISRNFAGAGGAAVLVVNDDHTSSTNIALDVNQDGTGGSTGVRIVHDGDSPAIDISAGAGRDGDVISIAMANMLDERALYVSGVITGTTGEGVIEVHATGVIPAGAALLRLDADTAQPGDGHGYMLNIDDDTLVVATPSKYAVLINSNANEALLVTKGQSTFDGLVQISNFSGGLDLDEDLAIDFDANDEEATISSSATDYGAGTAMVTMYNSGAGQTNNHYLLRLRHNADLDGQDHFIVCEDNNTTDVMFKVDSGGNTAVTGTLTVTGDTGLNAKLTMAKEVMFKHGGDIASPGGAELDLTDGTYFDITGTNNITSIAAADSVDGRFLILRFEAILTFTDGNNLKLAGNFVTTADDTITLICDGTDWWELARSAN